MSPVVTVREGTYRLTVGCDGGSSSPFDTHDAYLRYCFSPILSPSIIYSLSSLFFCCFPFFFIYVSPSSLPSFIYLPLISKVKHNCVLEDRDNKYLRNTGPKTGLHPRTRHLPYLLSSPLDRIIHATSTLRLLNMYSLL